MTILFLILLGLFLTLAAFALDLGNFYLWRLRIDKAARAGALAGLGYRGVHGWDYVKEGTGKADLEAAAREAVEDNLKAYGVALGPNDVKPTYNSNQDSIEVEVTHSPPTILVGKLSGILGFGFNPQTDASGNPIPQKGTIEVSRKHRAHLDRANVLLLLDVSGSMLCPTLSSDPTPLAPCSCRRTNTCGGGITTKLSKLVSGVERFAKHFNPNRDRFSVIAFNLAARQLYSAAGGKVMNQAQSVYPSLAASNTTAHQFLTNQGGKLSNVLEALAGSNTNHCDALAEGIRELELLSENLLGVENTGPMADRRNLHPFVVLFTDGAPNAIRGIFANADIDPGNCREYKSDGTRGPLVNCGTNDFYHYSLEWRANDGGVAKQYRGPGPFVARTLGPDGAPLLFNFAIAANQIAPATSKTCGIEVADGDPRKFERTITKNNSGNFPGERGDPNTGCLTGNSTDFSFSIPYTNPNPAGGFSGPYRASVSGVPISTNSTAWRDPNWPASFFALPPPAIPYGLQKYDELPYYCAIEAADYMRTRFAATIFTVGLGIADGHRAVSGQDSTCADPLQDADNNTSRKDFFLTRLSFARSMFTNQLSPVSVAEHYKIAGPQQAHSVTNCHAHRLKGAHASVSVGVGYTSADGRSDGNTTYLDLRPSRSLSMDTLFSGTDGRRLLETQGEYFPTDNADEIPRIFDLIAKTILLRAAS